MTKQKLYLFLADTILVAHVMFVLFVVLGLVLIYIGHFRQWQWVGNFWLRLVHLASIIYVVLQTWFAVVCPLTIWEMQLRAKAGAVTYSGSFIQHWLQTLLYYDFPQWVFVVVYTVFGFLVFGSWFWVKPKFIRKA